MNPQNNIEKLMSEKGVQFRDFKINKIETRKVEEDSEEMVIEGVPCVFNTPTVLYKIDGINYTEQIDSEAFREADMTDVIFNYNHCGRVYARTRNNTLKLEVKQDGLHMMATLRGDDEGHKQLYADIKAGTIDKMSFAFTVKTDEYDRDKHCRTVKAIDRLFDVSAVDIPAYDATEISARSFFEAERIEELKEIEERQRKLDVARAKYYYEEV